MNVVITGCSSGIGMASAVRFAADGWTVERTALVRGVTRPLLEEQDPIVVRLPHFLGLRHVNARVGLP
jgi:NAD(P)-dependent dehydrogenase (short-subunit alcohol dehydrogenase family)